MQKILAHFFINSNTICSNDNQHFLKKRNSQPQPPPKKRKKIFSIITFAQGVDSSAHLAHFKTEEEYDNLLHFSPNGDDSDRSWVGLFNNVGTTCDTPAECQGLLQWTDGSSYSDASW